MWAFLIKLHSQIFLLQGRDAESSFESGLCQQYSVPIGKIVYTQWLNEQGGIEADLTVTRTGEKCFMIVTAGATEYRDFNWLQSHIPQDAHAILTNVTSGYAVISLMGPRSRELMSTLDRCGHVQ